MRKMLCVLLAVLMIGSVALATAGGAELSTEQKFEVLKQHGIFTGFSDGSSGLYQSMTREQFARVLYKLMELPPPTGSPSYSDVLKTRWSYEEIEAVREAKLMVGIGDGKFGPQSPVTIEQLAAVLVRAYGQPGNHDYVTGNVSSWARVSVGIALHHDWIPQAKDYTAIANRGLLVEAAYAVFVQSRHDPLRVSSVVPINHRQIRVNFAEPASAVDAARFRVRDVQGKQWDVYDAALSWDGRSATITTEPLRGNQVYALYTDGVPWHFIAPAADTIKPVITALLPLSDQRLLLTFSEPLEPDSATRADHYDINRGLDITGIVLSDDGRSVTLYTERPRDGVRYRLTVKRVEDLAGNKINDWSGEFTADSTRPQVQFHFNEATARIAVIFSEKVKPNEAQNVNRYSIDRGVVVTRAQLDADGKTVYLTTSSQKDATIYTLSVSGISDLAGNRMDTATFRFGGVAHPVQQVKLHAISAVNQNTLEVAFDRAISERERGDMLVTIVKDNDRNVSMNDWLADLRFKPGSDSKVVIVQFRTERNRNPALFVPGHIYLARINGIPYLETAGEASSATFAGTEHRNVPPQVKEVKVLNRSTVKVTFTEPVKNVSADAFVIREKDGDIVKIEHVNVPDKAHIVTEVELDLADRLTRGQTYEMTLRPDTVTDAAGWNDWVTKEKLTFERA